MSSPMDLTSFDATMRDMYAAPGTRLKQWVVDMRREDEWERETCPKLAVPHHYDECDDIEAASGELYPCANVGPTSWRTLCLTDCRFCDGFAQAAQCLPEMLAWFAAKAERPPVCADHDLLSDEVQEDVSLRDHPLFSFLKVKR